MAEQCIRIRGAREHNLKDIDVEIPRGRFVVITGPSGSGKSSLAFDTLYAEGQRRYVESLSAYARQFLERMNKPDVDSIEGLSPAISIEQKSASRNPRSTVATVTEIYDYLRLLFARVGKPHCYQCGKPISAQSVQQIVDRVLALAPGSRFGVLAPVVRGRKGEFRRELDQLRKEGFVRVSIDGEVLDLDGPISLDKRKKHNIDVYVDRLVIKGGIQNRLTDSVETALRLADGLVKIAVLEQDEDLMFSERFACVDCGVSYPEIAPRLFSFNSPHGACQQCDGLGETIFFDPALVVPDPTRSIDDGAVVPWAGPNVQWSLEMLRSVVRHFGGDSTTPFEQLPAKAQRAVLEGSDEKIRFDFERDDGGGYRFSRTFEGVLHNLQRRLKETQSESIREQLQEYMSHQSCPACGGERLRIEARHVRLGKRSIADFTRMSVAQCADAMASLHLGAQDRQIAERILKELHERLGFLLSVGLEYLTLDRRSGTLSGGEGQRIRLATQIGSSLSGVLYVLDEPSIGLHQRDNERLIGTLAHLRDLGNTVVVVEHDEDTIRAADHVIDMGPGAGELGGRIVAQGTPKQVEASAGSLTGDYLSGRKSIPIPASRRERRRGQIVVRGARLNNLRNIDVEFPLGCFVCVTGVSGSGKSSLVLDTLYCEAARKLNRAHTAPGEHDGIDGLELLDKVIDIDQSPIGRTPRSNPATYTGLFTPLRDLFAGLPESRARGYKPGRYSFNVKGGRCETCEGDGILRIEMHFLPDVFVQCDECKGRRYNRETLDVRYRGKNIADVLEMTVHEALEFFEHHDALRNKLETLSAVGLGYVRLGQAATTLSGGEAQRVKLSKELSRRSTGRTLYILDEPTTGLHFDDIRKLLDVLDHLVQIGNTVVVIEHNLEVTKCADWIIDLGPEGGDGGGLVLATGTPEQIARVAQSHTGQHLARVLGKKRQGGGRRSAK